VTAPLTVRVAEEADLPALDGALRTGRNDVHRAFLARQATGEVSYLSAWRGSAAVGVGAVRWRRCCVRPGRARLGPGRCLGQTVTASSLNAVARRSGGETSVASS
jgi:hypothetical protein